MFISMKLKKKNHTHQENEKHESHLLSKISFSFAGMYLCIYSCARIQKGRYPENIGI